MTDLATLSAEQMLALYASGAASPLDVLQAVTERVARHNPQINAFAVMNPHALAAHVEVFAGIGGLQRGAGFVGCVEPKCEPGDGEKAERSSPAQDAAQHQNTA